MKWLVDGLLRLRAAEEGAAAVEFAFVLPLFLMLIAGLYDGARLIDAKMAVRAAAQAGASYALANGYDRAGIETAVTAASPVAATAGTVALTTGCAQGQAIQPNNGPSCPDGDPVGQYLTVVAQAPFASLAPWDTVVVPDPVTAQATVRIG